MNDHQYKLLFDETFIKRCSAQKFLDMRREFEELHVPSKQQKSQLRRNLQRIRNREYAQRRRDSKKTHEYALARELSRLQEENQILHQQLEQLHAGKSDGFTCYCNLEPMFK